MKKLFLYACLFIIAFFIGYLFGYNQYKDYHYDYTVYGHKIGNCNELEV